MQPVTVTNPDTGRSTTIFPTVEAIARAEAAGYDCKDAEKARKAWAKAQGSPAAPAPEAPQQDQAEQATDSEE